ncbi:MAG: hypothetical protein MJE77_43640 [Proteobacteria bacterium]|nr:hypothetical protein [Pseudomonadota bacterium]
MAGNRSGKRRTYINLMATMLIGGLWHGASWRFVVWGGLHGLYLAVHKMMTRPAKIGLSTPPSGIRAAVGFALKVVLTFHLVCLTWICFRAESNDIAVSYVAGLLSIPFDGALPDAELVTVAWVSAFLLLLIDYRCWYGDREVPVSADWSPWLRGLIYAIAFLAISFVGERDVPNFIYFQF